MSYRPEKTLLTWVKSTKSNLKKNLEKNMETNTSKLVQTDDIISNLPRAEPVPNSEPLSLFGTIR